MANPGAQSTSDYSHDSDPNVVIRWKERFAYASGDFASCLYFGVFANFLTYFYTDVFGISAAAVSLMILLTRTWDWINDPIMGAIADRTRTRMGVFRPWLLWMAGPFVIFGLTTFITPDLSPAGKLIYAYVTYTLLTMVYTAINVPYSALMGVMTSRSDQRTILASFRFIGAFAGTMFVSATMLFLVEIFGQGNERLGFPLTVGLYGVMAAGLFLFTFTATRERVPPPPREKQLLRDDFKALLRNGPWLVMILISVLTIIWIAVRNGIAIHYFKYASGSEHWGSLFLVISNGVQLVGVILTKYISQWLGGKKRAFMAITFVSAALIAAFYFIDPQNIPLVMAHQFISSFISAPLMPLFWSMIADTADYGAWKLGQRTTGIIFSSGTASQKIGWSIGPAIAMWLLGYFGYIANVDQTPETLHGMKLIMSWIPAGVAVIAGMAVMLYKITPEVEKEMQAAIKMQSAES